MIFQGNQTSIAWEPYNFGIFPLCVCVCVCGGGGSGPLSPWIRVYRTEQLTCLISSRICLGSHLKYPDESLAGTGGGEGLLFLITKI